METTELGTLDRLHSVYSDHPPKEEVLEMLAELRDPNPPRILKPMPMWMYSVMMEIQREMPHIRDEGLHFDVLADIIELVYIFKALEDE